MPPIPLLREFWVTAGNSGFWFFTFYSSFRVPFSVLQQRPVPPKMCACKLATQNVLSYRARLVPYGPDHVGIVAKNYKWVGPQNTLCMRT